MNISVVCVSEYAVLFLPTKKKYAFTLQGFCENVGLPTRFLKILRAEDLLCSSVFCELWLQFVLFWLRIL